MKHLKTLPLLLLLFASAVTAAAFSFSSIVKQAEVIKANAVVSANSTMIKVSTTIKGFAANDPYMVKNIDVPKANFLSHAKNNMNSLAKRNAWYAGWLATMAAAGWAIDELTGQMTKPNVVRYGSCWIGNSNVSAYNTYSFCFDLAQKAIHNAGWVGIGVKPVNNPDGTITYFYADTTATNNSYGSFRFVKSQNTGSDPVPDDALYDSLISHMLQDPKKAADAFMVPDAWPYPYPNIFPDTVPYIPGVSEADQEALDLYYKGLLQSTNPNAPYYVTPERYQQIKDLATKLEQGQTPQGQTDAMNDQLKKPLTQAELEETLKKRDAEQKKEAEEIAGIDKKPITDAYKDSKLKEEYDKLKERVTDPSKMPQLPPLPAADQIDLPSYKGCQTITMNMFNAVLTFPNPDQCKKLEQVKTGLGYLMYVLTALGIIMELFRRVE